MIKKYRNLRFSTRLLVITLIALLVIAISIKNDYNVFIALGVTFGLGIAFDIIAFKPKTTVSVALCLLQAAIVVYEGYYFGAIFAGMGLDFVLFSVITLSILGTGSLIVGYIAFRFSKRKVWLTLVICFTTLNFSGFLIGSYSELDFITSIIISVIISITIAIILSSNIFKRKIRPEYTKTRIGIRNTTAITTAKSNFTKQKWDFVEYEQNSKAFIVDTGKVIAIVFPIGFQGILTKDKKDIFYEGISVGNLFAELIDEARKISIATKIPKKNTTVIILDTTNKYPVPDRKFEKLTLTAKHDSRDNVDNVIIANNRGIINYNNSLNILKEGYNSSFVKLMSNS